MTFFVTNDDVQLNYHEYGKDNKPVIVFLNGYSASEVTWILQIDAFVRAGFRVITYDYRGHGLSEKVNYGLTLHRLAMDLNELIEKLQLSNVILIGHSMGAALIMAYEELFTDRYIAQIVTEDQSPTFFKSPDWLDGKTGRSLENLAEFMDHFPKTRLTRKRLSDDVKRRLGKSMYPFDFVAYRALLQNVILQDWRMSLTRETVPHLFLAGGQSPVFPPEHAQAARQLQCNPHSKAIIFEACGHILHVEEPEKFNQIVLDFIKGNEKS